MINFKQIELSNMLFEKLANRFPDLKLVGITESPESQNGIWVNVTMPKDEDKEEQIYDMASEISVDILLDYGYDIIIFGM